MWKKRVKKKKNWIENVTFSLHWIYIWRNFFKKKENKKNFYFADDTVTISFSAPNIWNNKYAWK